jgi:hypothetical protein
MNIDEKKSTHWPSTSDCEGLQARQKDSAYDKLDNSSTDTRLDPLSVRRVKELRQALQ